MRSFILLLSLVLLIAIAGCKKSPPPKKTAKSITALYFLPADNPGVLAANIYGIVGTDTITVGFPLGTSLSSLVPVVDYLGVGINPQGKVAQNFTHPVNYTVTAEDGSTHTYVVVCRYLSNAHEITSFAFKAADNAGLTADVAGTITGDTIVVLMDSGVDISNLVPTITYTAGHVSPESHVAQDFSAPVSYLVVAEDGTGKTYTVIVEQNLVLYIGGTDGYLYSLNATTGMLNWKTATGAPVYSSPTVYNGTVYAGSTNGYLYALDAATGAQKWQFYGSGEFYSTPVIYNGNVYINGNGGYLYAVNATTGIMKWSYYLGYSSGGGNPTISGGTVYIGNAGAGTGLYAIDATTGVLKWQQSGMGICASNPVILNGAVYAGGEQYKLAALDTATGAYIWKVYDQKFGSGSGPTISNGIAYIGTFDGNIYAFDVVTGNAKWNFTSYGIQSGAGSGVFSSPVVANGIVYAGNNDSYIYALDAAAGTLKWKYGNSVRTNVGAPSPTVANGILYSGNYDSYVYAFNAKTGAVKWRFITGGGVYSGPCIVDVKGNVFHPGISGEQN